MARRVLGPSGEVQAGYLNLVVDLVLILVYVRAFVLSAVIVEFGAGFGVISSVF